MYTPLQAFNRFCFRSRNTVCMCSSPPAYANVRTRTIHTETIVSMCALPYILTAHITQNTYWLLLFYTHLYRHSLLFHSHMAHELSHEAGVEMRSKQNNLTPHSYSCRSIYWFNIPNHIRILWNIYVQWKFIINEIKSTYSIPLWESKNIPIQVHKIIFGYVYFWKISIYIKNVLSKRSAHSNVPLTPSRLARKKNVFFFVEVRTNETMCVCIHRFMCRFFFSFFLVLKRKNKFI